MRVLVVASPLTGHVLPLVPLAQALRVAGHDVLFATAAEGVDVVRRAGLPVQDVAPGFSQRRAFTGPLLRHPVRIGRMLGGDEGTDGVGLLFASVSSRTAEGTVALARGWHPDLVLHEGLAAAGALAAARCGVPSVLVDALVFDGWALFRAVAGNLVRTGRRGGAGLPEPVEAVVAIPPSLVGERRGRPMRYLPAPSTGGLPADLRLPRERPTLLVSRSTADDPRPDRMMSRVVEAATGAEVDVVLVRPDRRAMRNPLPANVTTTDWLPFADAFPLVAGVVHHGGSGTLMTALVAGVPQIVVPGAGDRTLHARLLARRGAGLAVPLAELDGATLERLVRDASLTANAREVAAEIAAMPHPAEVVPHLEALAAR
jgi:UDP:flavonoid glycosyltransferase YjiC (YdhE family)